MYNIPLQTNFQVQFTKDKSENIRDATVEEIHSLPRLTKVYNHSVLFINNIMFYCSVLKKNWRDLKLLNNMLNIDCCEAGQNKATNQQKKKTAEKAA